MKRYIATSILLFALSWSFAQEFLSVHELTGRREVVEMPVNSAEVIFLATTNDIAITTSNKSVDLVYAPTINKDGLYEYVVMLDLSGGHTDRHFTVEKQGTTFRATTKRKTLFSTGDRRYFMVEEPNLKVMLTQPEEKVHLVKNEACVEFYSPYPNLRVDTSGLLKARIETSVSQGGAFITAIKVSTPHLDNLRAAYEDSESDLWDEVTTITVRFDSSNASSVSVAELRQRILHRYNIVPVSGSGRSAENLCYLSIAFSPSEAVVRLDGTLLPSVQGKASAFVAPGSHQYDIECPYYHAVSDTVQVSEKSREMAVALKPAFGYLKVTGDGVRGATVLINGKEVGTAPFSSDRLMSGKYSVELAKNLYFSYKEDVIIRDAETYEISTSLKPDYAHVTFAVANDAEIYVDNSLAGKGQFIADLRSGKYVVKARKDGYTTTEDTIVITPEMMDKVFVLQAPTPIYGLLAIRTRPAKATVWNKDTMLCLTPRLVRTLVGTYDLKIAKKGRDTVRLQAEVQQRRCLEVRTKLPTAGRNIPDSSLKVKMAYIRHPVAYQRGTLLIFHLNYAWEQRQLAYGISIGRLRRCGWTLNLNSNFNFNGLDSKRRPYGSTPSDSSFTRFTATFGFVVRTCNVLSLRVGGGIGYLARNYKMANQKWYPDMSTRIIGPQLDAGFALHLNPMMITFEYSTTYFRYHEARIGLGFCIQKKVSATPMKKKKGKTSNK